MLEHLSPKFKMPPMEREPRAALILNRFTRTLTVMFATNAVSAILGVRPDQIKGKSFYECIQENCLQDAIKCLESAKANDSIAYLRFWYRDPRREDDFEDEEEEEEEEEEEDDDEEMTDDEIPNDADTLARKMDLDGEGRHQPAFNSNLRCSSEARSSRKLSRPPLLENPQAAMPGAPGRPRHEPILSFELEAVVSCTSDGLVVVLRKARPPIPAPHPPLLPFDFENGLFAAPWGKQSITPYYPPDLLYTFRPPLLPQFMPLRDNVKAAGGPPLDQLMKSIRDVAVFAWALVGINGSLAAYSRGLPLAEAQPPDGLPIWDPSAVKAAHGAPENQAARRWASSAADEDKGKGRDDVPHPNLGFGLEQSRGFQNYSQSHPPIWPPPALPQQPGHSQQHQHRPFPSTLPHPHPPPSFNLQQVSRQHSAAPGLAGGSYPTTRHKNFDRVEASTFGHARFRLPAPQPGHDLLKPFYKWG
jgi:ribosomal protein L12E/L44/L45/RPP1/RPP2